MGSQAFFQKKSSLKGKWFKHAHGRNPYADLALLHDLVTIEFVDEIGHQTPISNGYTAGVTLFIHTYMIIAYTAGGRTANQVFHYFYLMAIAMEFDLSFRIIDFRSHGYFDFFDSGKAVCSYHPSWIRILNRMCRSNKLSSFLKLVGIRSLRVYGREESGALTQEVRKLMKGLSFLDCWPVKDYELLYKHQEAVRKTIRPKKEYWNAAEEIMTEQRGYGVPIVGVHVRRTDYKEWLDGKYYYDVSIYVRHMRKISELMNGKVVFVICSDETMTREDFEVPCCNLYISRNPFMVDYSLLAQCDYTIGPPSTFRMTSSFLGNTPSFSLYTPDIALTSMEQFIVPLMGNVPVERKRAAAANRI